MLMVVANSHAARSYAEMIRAGVQPVEAASQAARGGLESYRAYVEPLADLEKRLGATLDVVRLTPGSLRALAGVAGLTGESWRGKASRPVAVAALRAVAGGVTWAKPGEAEDVID